MMPMVLFDSGARRDAYEKLGGILYSDEELEENPRKRHEERIYALRIEGEKG